MSIVLFCLFELVAVCGERRKASRATEAGMVYNSLTVLCWCLEAVPGMYLLFDAAAWFLMQLVVCWLFGKLYERESVSRAGGLGVFVSAQGTMLVFQHTEKQLGAAGLVSPYFCLKGCLVNMLCCAG